MNHFGLNIKNIRLFWDLSQSEMAHLIGASRGMIMQYENRGSVPKDETVAKTIELTGFSKEALFETQINRDEFKALPEPYKHVIDDFREGAVTKGLPSAADKALKYRIALKERRKPVPMYNVKIAAGSVAVFNDQPELIVEFVDAPFIGIVDGAVEVVGESMAPTFKPGARAVVRRLEDKMLLNWGEVYYIVDANYEGYIKRLYQGNDDTHIVLKSDNPDREMYPSFSRRWEDIVAVFKVKADITKH